MTIGENLKRARTAKKLSQRALAEKIEVGGSTYIGWEHDTNPPPADKLILLAQALDTSVEELLFGENAGLSEEMQDLFRRFDSLPTGAKAQARMMLRALLFSLESGATKAEDAA